MRLSDSRYESIKKDVATLYQKYNIKSLPINPFVLCEKMNIKLVKYSDLTIEERNRLISLQPDGFKDEHENGTVIFYNDMQHPSKIKFTLLHEIGHIVRGHKEFSPLAESEAEWFAAYAIAPPPVVNLFEISDFTDIMEIFDTTFNCAWHSMSRYLNWKRFARKDTEYDIILRNLFSSNA